MFERNDAIGGLLRYGIPDFKMEKSHIDRRVAQMEAEGVVFRTGVRVGTLGKDDVVTDWSAATVSPDELMAQFDAVVLAAGAERSRDLPVPGRDLAGRALRDGVPAAAEQGQRRRQGRGADPRRRART